MNVDYISNMVHKFYWVDDYNCATTVMKSLESKYSIEVKEQVINSLIGMHGAGKYGAQCGLVEGSLMFLGIYGKDKGLDNNTIVDLCYKFAEGYEKRFGSLRCSALRPEGFSKNNPPHLCENLTIDSIKHAIDFVEEYL